MKTADSEKETLEHVFMESDEQKRRSSVQFPEEIKVQIANELAMESEDSSNARGNYVDDASTIVAAYRGINRMRLACGAFVNHEKMQLAVVILISVNAILMGIGTFNFVSENPAVNDAFEKADTVFLVFFTIELILQFIYHGLHLFLDGWLVFDFVIIIMSWSFASLQIIRAFRIFRALRLVTRIKVMKNLILALFAVMPRMVAIGLLLFLIFYIYAVMFTQLFGDLYERGLTDDNYFGRMDLSFFTLFQIMTLDAMDPVTRQIMAAVTWSWFPILTFVIISAFIVVNLIIAVLCDAISALQQEEKVKLMVETLAEESGDHDGRSPQEHVRDELVILEDRVHHLSLMQERTLKALTLLTEHLGTTSTSAKTP